VVLYRIELSPRARRDLRKLPRSDQVRVAARINELAGNPRPAGAVKLAGAEDLWRVRVGEYRIVYQVRGVRLQVLIVLVGHRGDIYRRLRDL
jgi:mRNA interferase RelE/StbE